MAYSVDDIVGQINKLKASGNEAQAYALYNGVTGMGGNGLANPGNLKTALKNTWGASEADQWVNNNTTKYGNTLFDPKTGQWGGWGDAYGQSGTIEGWDPTQFDPAATYGAALNYTPATTFTPPAGGVLAGMAKSTPEPSVGAGASTTPATSTIPRPGGTSTGGALPTVAPTEAPFQQADPRGSATGTPPAGAVTPPPSSTVPPVATLPTTTTPATTTAPPPSATGVPVTKPNAQQAQTLETKARQILGAYFKMKPDGTPDWDAMSNSGDFYNSLPDTIKQQITAEKLGAAMRTAAGLPLLPGMALPDWYASSGSGVQPEGNYVPPTYNAPVYQAPPQQEVDPGNPMDFFNDEGYQFRLKEGGDSIENSAAARGGLLSGNTLKELQKYASGLASDEYNQAFDRYANQRNFDRATYEDERDKGRADFESDRGFGRGVFEGDRGFDFTNYKDYRDYLENIRNKDLDRDESIRRFDLTFDRDSVMSDRDYNEKVRQFELAFDRDTAINDRNFNYSNLKDLADMGLRAGSIDATAAAQITTLLAQLAIAQGNAGAGASVGQANVINDLITQILGLMSGNKTVNAVTKP